MNNYQWIWKWHFIGGLVSFPIAFVLALTGIIYLFKDQYEAPRQAYYKEVAVKSESRSFQEQWDLAKQAWDQPVQHLIIPNRPDQATEFTSGRFSGKSSLFMDPYSGKVTRKLAVRDTDMFKVRKLHGELLAGGVGTKLVELVGSWMVVLIFTGLFLFFPRQKKDWIKLFHIRLKGPKQVLFRDIHMVGGFWFSIILLLILAGGLPWTDVWGTGFKWVQQQTQTGYPPQWNGKGLSSHVNGDMMRLDEVVSYARSLELPGEITISFPRSPKGVFSIHNTFHPDLSRQVAIHVDAYSGEKIASLEWKEVGILMRARMWAMAFHQGQFGFWNWLLVLFTASGLLLLSTSAIVSYFLRKKRSPLGIPGNGVYQISPFFYTSVGIMAILLPLFGLSVLLILVVAWISNYFKSDMKLAKNEG